MVQKTDGRYRLSFVVSYVDTEGTFPFEIEVRDQASNKLQYLAEGEYGLNVIKSDVSTSNNSTEKAVYRFYSELYRSHFYTNSTQERDSIIESDKNWTYEGEVFGSFSSQQDGLSQVYRFYSENFRSHFYTLSESERDGLVASDPNWNYEGIAYYTYTSAGTGREALYRFYSDIFQSHFYTTSESERDGLINNDPNWRFEGIAWYVQE